MRLLCSTDRLIRSVRWSRCSARFKVGAIQNHPLPPTVNLCLLLGLHRPGAFNLAPLGPSNKIYVISSSFTGCRFNHLRAIVELTAPSASSGAQSAGTISKHLGNPPPHLLHGGQSTLRAASTGGWSDCDCANFSHLCLLTEDVNRFFFFSVFPPTSFVSPHRERKGSWTCHPLQCQSATKRSGSELSCTFCVIRVNFLGQMSHERGLITKSFGHADLRHPAHFTRQTRAEHVVSRNDNWQFGCWADLCRFTFRMGCNVHYGCRESSGKKR